ncbi:MAG: hypothetical protein AAGJ51_04430 [Pseudomonadota bacterium]
MSGAHRIYYWLVPCAKDAARFSDVVAHLADTQNAPVFTPHMSLAAIDGDQPDLQPCIDILSGLVVAPVEIDMTDAFTMSLFVRIERHPALLRARAYMEAQPGIISSRAFDPHLSLCYGPPPAGAADWDAVKALSEQPIRFDRLKTVDIPPRVETYDDIRAWKALQSIPF